MNPSKLILNTCGHVYLRNCSSIDGILKVGLTSVGGFRRASLGGATILRLNLSLNHREMEQALIKGFREKYEVYAGKEYFVCGDLREGMQLFDQIFAKCESKIYEKLMASNLPNKVSIKLFNETEDIDEEEEDDEEPIYHLRKRKRIH